MIILTTVDATMPLISSVVVVVVVVVVWEAGMGKGNNNDNITVVGCCLELFYRIKYCFFSPHHLQMSIIFTNQFLFRNKIGLLKVSEEQIM